ncbi:2-keto-4-pentenoate hydratase [Litorimonas cladophorae]|uniref:2-keto-4-pentenoate hydratase n=1 Tax=Litorimonas cladophorae TaxID=1220491 RepID=A0A918KI94_9PROT|nr:2-keto-4-pentenoate hydratase [Litorimonas cladophorae]GGX61871.1 2-keto-4-pentenoate hydratase [Litorimonas cladophorae]
MTATLSDLEAVADAFTSARRNCRGLTEYPGKFPASLPEAYRIQDIAISKWPHKIAGWKVGGIGPEQAAEVGASKLAGPVFAHNVHHSTGERIPMPIYAEGFGAVEAEIVFEVSRDAPVDKLDWTLEAAKKYIGDVRLGVEVASSPFPHINEMGAFAPISDFGNNHGLILGEILPNWNESSLDDWIIETVIEGKSMGAKAPPEPYEAFRFILENTARRGIPLKKGMLITTGAVTGVHRAYSGQSSTVSCTGVADIDLILTSQKPE